MHNTSTSPPPRPPPTTSWCTGNTPGHRPLPLSLSCGLPKGCIGEGNHHRHTPSCCKVSGYLSKAVYFRISAGNGVPGDIWSPYVFEYAEVPLVRCWSRCSKIFTTLRSATSSSSSSLVQERNPRVSVYEGTCPKLLPLQYYY
jgi:hypothetical protein